MTAKNHQAKEIIKRLEMKPLPMEGGYYIETYRADDRVEGRPLCTCILFLITRENFSKLHRLRFAEIYHFYYGDPVTMLNITDEGKTSVLTLGSDLFKGERVQHIVPANCWQGSFLKEGGTFALMGATMSPGFEFRDYESAEEYKTSLSNEFPGLSDMLFKLI